VRPSRLITVAPLAVLATALLAWTNAGGAPRSSVAMMLGDGLRAQQSLAPGVDGSVRFAPPAAAPRDQAAPPATARADCGPGSHPNPGLQGEIPASEAASGAAADGYTCNTELVGHEGSAGGYKVERFVDRAGHECAYYDTTLLFPLQAAQLKDQSPGVAVLDMSNPAKPVRTATLVTPAMQAPHESLLVNQKRGLLAAVLGNPIVYPGQVDVYDLNTDCRYPELQSSLPTGILGHESGFAKDGNTFYATSLQTGGITAIDVSNPKLPVTLGVYRFPSHGLTLSDDGNRAYVAGIGVGLQILDTSEIQARKPNPQVHLISQLGWSSLTIPQVAMSVTIGGRPYLVEIDEFATDTPGSSLPSANGQVVGAGRIIDISDERAPRVVSNLRLEVNQPENRAKVAGDPGASSSLQGDAGHYCNVPQEVDPGIVACSFIASGLRVFDIRDPYHPKELAYFVAPLGPSPVTAEKSDYAMSRPSFAPKRGEIWYSDGNSGFYSLRVTNGRWPFRGGAGSGSKPPPHPNLGLPGTRRCASRRRLVIHLRAPRGMRLRSVRVYVGSRRVRALSGVRTRARIDLRGLPKGRFRVRVVAVTTTGGKIVDTRRYRTCRPRHRGRHRRARGTATRRILSSMP
jgi:hypothetical protein